MTDRDRFLAVLGGRPADRCVYTAWANPWPETVQRWRAEGYEPEKGSPFAHDRWLGMSRWFFPDPPFRKKVLEETADSVLYVNEEGITMRERRDQRLSSMPQFVRFPVESREDFRKFWKARMRPDLAHRIGRNHATKLRGFRGRREPLLVIADRWGGFFGGLRAMVGVERLCLLFHDDPAWVEEMMDAVADFLIAMMEGILAHTDVDLFGFWEDMAYKTGPLVGPAAFRKLALPRYRRVAEFVRGKGVPHVAVDSDGDIRALIPVWLDAGIDVVYPFEVQAGMDVREMRRKFGPGLKMWGGVDKRALAVGPAAIDAELARVAPLVREGGYIPALDHSVPPDVSWPNFLHYGRKLREIL
jgi:uroporphyrinogen decarboxylase